MAAEELRPRVERAELELRLLEAEVRIQRARLQLTMQRIANERALGIDRFAERAEDLAAAEKRPI